MGDAITLVTYTYEVGSALVKRCQLVKQCHSESARIAMRTLRVLAQLDKAAASFSSPELDASLVELKDVLERAQDLVAKCQKVKGVSAKLGALVKANTLKGELVRVEADLDRVANDLQLPILTDIRRAVESIGERELEAGGGEGGTCAEELEQTVRAAIRKELETSAGGPDGRLVKEIIGEKLSQAYAGETPEPVPETPEPVGTGVLRCSGHGEECALRTVKKPVRSRSTIPVVLQNIICRSSVHVLLFAVYFLHGYFLAGPGVSFCVAFSSPENEHGKVRAARISHEEGTCVLGEARDAVVFMGKQTPCLHANEIEQ